MLICPDVYWRGALAHHKLRELTLPLRLLDCRSSRDIYQANRARMGYASSAKSLLQYAEIEAPKPQGKRVLYSAPSSYGLLGEGGAPAPEPSPRGARGIRVAPAQVSAAAVLLHGGDFEEPKKHGRRAGAPANQGVIYSENDILPSISNKGKRCPAPPGVNPIVAGADETAVSPRPYGIRVGPHIVSNAKILLNGGEVVDSKKYGRRAGAPQDQGVFGESDVSPRGPDAPKGIRVMPHIQSNAGALISGKAAPETEPSPRGQGIRVAPHVASHARILLDGGDIADNRKQGRRAATPPPTQGVIYGDNDVAPSPREHAQGIRMMARAESAAKSLLAYSPDAPADKPVGKRILPKLYITPFGSDADLRPDQMMPSPKPSPREISFDAELYRNALGCNRENYSAIRNRGQGSTVFA